MLGLGALASFLTPRAGHGGVRAPGAPGV